MGVVRDTSGWWGEQCESRGAALSHVQHGRQTGCDDASHADDVCCFCGLLEGAALPPPRVWQAAPERRNVQQDHRFVFSIWGCNVCRRPESEHPIFLPTPGEECAVDHNSINTALLIGDGGQERTRCPVCNVQVEPMMARGYPEGPQYGPGRLPWVKRRWAKIIDVKLGWLGGFYKS